MFRFRSLLCFFFLFVAHRIQKLSIIPDVSMHVKLIDGINKSFKPKYSTYII